MKVKSHMLAISVLIAGLLFAKLVRQFSNEAAALDSTHVAEISGNLGGCESRKWMEKNLGKFGLLNEGRQRLLEAVEEGLR